jgi:hypothetical protein
MWTQRRRLGGAAAVGAAAAILAVCAAGGPLYISSAASESVQRQLDDGCLADDGLQLSILPGHTRGPLDGRATSIAHVTGRPVVTSTTQPYLYHRPGTEDVQWRVVLAHREGQFDHFGDGIVRPGPGEVLLPDWYLRIGGVAVGDRLDVTVPSPALPGVPNRPVIEAPEPTTLELTVVGTYPEIPIRPEPAFWCGLRSFLRPNAFGDPPLPLGLVDASTLELLPAEQQHRIWELRPDSSGLTRDEARQLSERFEALAGAHARDSGLTVEELRELDVASIGLPAVTSYAERLSEVVSRTVAPVRITGVAASAALLAAAGVLLAREHRRELRLRLLRGVGPVSTATRIGASAAPAVLVGSAVGVGLVLVAVVTVGPTPELEPATVVSALVTTAAAAAIAVALVATVGTIAAGRTVDTRRRAHSPRWLVVPVLVLAVGLTVASALRLDRAGGVRLVGSEPQGGDLLAQAFPLLAIATPLLLLAAPLAWALHRFRFAGRSLRPSLLLGVRRVVLEPPVTVTLVAAIALASGTYVVAGALTASAEQSLDDKAGVFLGSDLVLTTGDVSPLPEALADQATIVQRSLLRSGSYGVDLLGVDAGSFERAVTWRGDATGRSLASTLDAIQWDGREGPVPAIVVGRDLDDLELRSPQGRRLAVSPVMDADFFPGYRNGATLVVVDRDALETAGLALVEEIWIRQPPADATDILRDAGFVVRSPHERAEVFDVTSFLTVRWAYGALAAFGLLVALVVVIAQLLVLDARREPRQVAFVLTRPMGHRAGDEAIAVLIELALPMVAGVALGTAIGVAASRFAVLRLDTLRQLRPPARVVVDVSSFIPLGLLAVLAIGALTATGVLAAMRARPMEAMRATA